MNIYSALSGDPFLISSTESGRQVDPEITFLSEGGFVAVWNAPGQDDPATFSDGIFGRVYGSDGQPIGPEFQVNTTTFNDQRAPHVTATEGGGFTVLWDSFRADGSVTNIIGRSFSGNGTPSSPEFDVNTTLPSVQRSVATTALNNGSLAAAWESATQNGIAVRIISPSGAGEDDFLVSTTLQGTQQFAAIDALSDGSFVVTWNADVGTSSSHDIFAQRVGANGALIGDEILVNSDVTGGQFRSDVAGLASGGFVVTWESSFLTSRSVQARVFDASGAPVGEDITVNTHGSPALGMPSITPTADGGYLIAWLSGGVFGNDTLPGGHYGQRYDGTGTPIGSEFLISTDISSQPAAVRLDASETGDLIAVWAHTTGAAENGGIRGQLILTAGEITGDDTSEMLRGAELTDRIDGAGGNDTISGFDGADILIGGAGDDFIFGGETEGDLRDQIFGGAGNDSLDGGFGNDELRGDSGNDTLVGGFGADTVIGGTGDDVMTGAAFSDLMFGGDGDDFVNGGFGSDRVNGGAGADQFYHLGIFDHGNDWIQDYNAAEGDVLFFGDRTATADQFQINRTTTPTAGADDVEEAFVIYIPTEQIIWALVDGAGQDAINIRIGTEIFDLNA